MDTDKRDPINMKLQIKPLKVTDEFLFVFIFNSTYDMPYPNAIYRYRLLFSSYSWWIVKPKIVLYVLL